MITEVNLTYETLFEILRREKNKEELQKLEPDFFENLLSYLKDKLSMLNNDQKSLFDDTENNEKQIENVRKLIKELYFRRQKKIIETALNKCRTGSKIIDNSTMMEQEKQMYEQLVAVLETFKKGIVNRILDGKMPEITDAPKTHAVSEEQEQQPIETKTKTVRFINAVPKFVGRDLEIYGPFEQEDIAHLPADIADILVQKERATELKQ